jgi:hypothetical protein
MSINKSGDEMNKYAQLIRFSWGDGSSKPSIFKLTQIVGFMCAVFAFLILLILRFSVPYSADLSQIWIPVVTHSFIPWYAATAIMEWDNNGDIVKGSITVTLIGFFLGGFLLLAIIFTPTNGWVSIIVPAAVELISATIAGLGIGKGIK